MKSRFVLSVNTQATDVLHQMGVLVDYTRILRIETTSICFSEKFNVTIHATRAVEVKFAFF